LELALSAFDAPPNVSTVSTDDALIRAAQRGDSKAFERLYRIHVGRVMGLCLRMTRRRDVAEDCVQQTFVRAWRNLAAFEGRSAFGTWLHRIAVNEVLTQARNRGTRIEADERNTGQDRDRDESGHGLDADATVDTGGAGDAGEVMDVERVLATLPPGSREVVVLQAIYGYSHEEVADMLGIAVGTCKAQLHRGRRLLRERLGLPENEP
jgi:RNA polymerase sigma-70 factor (ECF subfamily)